MRSPRLPAGLSFQSTVALITLLTCAAMVVLGWHMISVLQFRDTDDALRYVQVRDFLAGQSWFDVSQHRVNPPHGGMMHWSRIVDLPIAALMLLFRPLVGIAMADRIALACAPLLLTCGLFFAFANAARRIAGPAQALLATAMLPLSLTILIQFQPMRIDHHGWQIMMSAVTLWACFDGNWRRGGVIAGASVALWMHISSEGLPYAAAFGGVFALAYAYDARGWSRLLIYTVTVAVTSALLLVGTRGWPEAAALYCDAISPVYLLPMLAAAVSLPIAHRLIGDGHGHWARRLTIPALAGIAGAVTYLCVAGDCLKGPFETLDPIVYNNWYLLVQEGRPIWDQDPLMRAVIVAPALIGMIGMVLAIRRSVDVAARLRWIALFLLMLGAFGVSLMVMRAMSVAHLFALPGIAFLIFESLPKARALKSTPLRIITTIALFALTPVGLTAIITVIVPPSAADAEAASRKPQTGPDCSTRLDDAGLAALPRGLILSQLDIGPNLLAFTPHSVVATGHHRNHLAMRDVILTFTSRPDIGHSLALAHHVQYLAYCPGTNEGMRYALHRPQSLMADLHAGRIPHWLQPIAMRPGEKMRVLRVLP